MNRVGAPEFSEKRKQTRKSSLWDDCHHVIRHHRDCHGMINASVRCLFSLIEEGLVGWLWHSGGGVARAGECIYMYTETANKHSADLNNVSPNRILQRCDVVALLLAIRNLIHSKYRFALGISWAGRNLTYYKNNIAAIIDRTCSGAARSISIVIVTNCHYFTAISCLKLKAGVT